MTDAELLRRARTGEGPALAELLSRWAPKALAWSHVYIQHQQANDLAQESLLRAIRNLAQLKDPEKFGPWLRSIVKRTSCDWLQSRKRDMIPFSTLPIQSLDVHQVQENSIQDDKAIDLAQAVAELPEEYQEVLRLYYAGKTTYEELARLLDVSPATINARLTKARAMLRARLTPQWETRP